MRNIDTSAYSSTKPSRIKPDDIDLGHLPPITKPVQATKPEPSPSVPVVQVPETPLEPTTLVGSAVFPSPSARVPMPESQKARNLASQTTRMPESQKSGIDSFVAEMLNLKNADKTSFRYPQALIDMLADVEWDLRRNRGKKVHKNTIVVVALAYLLWDYQKRGADSLLVSLS